MLRIGLTGGIGSGKSIVAGIFEVLGIPVYNADNAAKRLMNSSPSLKASIISYFGEAVYINGELNRKLMAQIVFNDPEKLKMLNALTHPATIKDAEEWMHSHETPGKLSAPYIIKEAALLFESGADKKLDKVIGVWAPLPLRIKRVMKRDDATEEEIRKRISRQMDEDEKMKRCDFVITNDESALIIPQVMALDKIFRS